MRSIGQPVSGPRGQPGQCGQLGQSGQPGQLGQFGTAPGIRYYDLVTEISSQAEANSEGPSTGIVVLAAAAHPDDIEFMMAGTLLLLGSLGAELHMFNLANGCCGTVELDRDEIVSTRFQEAQQSALLAGARLQPPLVDDGLIFYDQFLLSRCAALFRIVQPDILLLPSPDDYMEDHQNTSRLMVTAAFVRGMKNFSTVPDVAPCRNHEVTLYHAMPYGLRDGMRKIIQPEIYVDIGSVLQQKREMLACHRSQKEWLDVSQGINAYLDQQSMMSARVGDLSGRFEHAEGWRRHSHLGYSSSAQDPLSTLLSDTSWVDPDYKVKTGIRT